MVRRPHAVDRRVAEATGVEHPAGARRGRDPDEDVVDPRVGDPERATCGLARSQVAPGVAGAAKRQASTNTCPATAGAVLWPSKSRISSESGSALKSPATTGGSPVRSSPATIAASAATCRRRTADPPGSWWRCTEKNGNRPPGVSTSARSTGISHSGSGWTHASISGQRLRIAMPTSDGVPGLRASQRSGVAEAIQTTCMPSALASIAACARSSSAQTSWSAITPGSRRPRTAVIASWRSRCGPKRHHRFQVPIRMTVMGSNADGSTGARRESPPAGRESHPPDVRLRACRLRASGSLPAAAAPTRW